MLCAAMKAGASYCGHRQDDLALEGMIPFHNLLNYASNIFIRQKYKAWLEWMSAHNLLFSGSERVVFGDKWTIAACIDIVVYMYQVIIRFFMYSN